MRNVDVTVSIVSYNSKHVIKDCIDSIYNSIQDINIETIVVDNCSEDGSAGLIKKHFPAITFIENKENVGFGKAHNQAFRLSKGRYFLILNPDTVIDSQAIDKMVSFMDSHDRAGVVGCKVWWGHEKEFLFPDLRIHNLKTAMIHLTPICRYFPNLFVLKWYWKSAYQFWNSKSPILVEGISGGLMMVRREVFQSIGLFDENFFLLFEEHDLLRRIKNGGWHIYYLPHAEIVHLFEESFRSSTIDTGHIYLQSALYYFKKHYKALGYYFIKFLIRLNRMILHLEKYFGNILMNNQRYTTVHPDKNGNILINWPTKEGTTRYLVEISYAPEFCDRAGMYVRGKTLLLKDHILKRLPNKTGFIRVMPAYGNYSTGRVIKIMKITDS